MRLLEVQLIVSSLKHLISVTYWILPWNREVYDLPGSLRDFGFVE